MGMMDVSAEDNEIQKGHLLCKIFRFFFYMKKTRNKAVQFNPQDNNLMIITRKHSTNNDGKMLKVFLTPGIPYN